MKSETLETLVIDHPSQRFMETSSEFPSLLFYLKFCQKYLYLHIANRESKRAMEKRTYMRPQDIVILVKKITPTGRLMSGKQLAESIGISQSEVSESLDRSRYSGLVDESKTRVNTLALREFLVYGLKYCFPVKPGSIVRGVPTFVSAPPLNDIISSGSESFVWPDPQGQSRGQAIEPLYPSVPRAVQNDDVLYRLLALIDTLRVGRTREVSVALKEIDNYLKKYGEKQPIEA